MPPPPPLDTMPTSSLPLSLVAADGDYHQASEDDLPPPPSPVSSSYSELRRATDNTSYQSMPSYPTQPNNNHNNNINANAYQHLNINGPRPTDIGAAIAAAGGGGGNSVASRTGGQLDMQQTYGYQPEYGTYVPSSQVSVFFIIFI